MVDSDYDIRNPYIDRMRYERKTNFIFKFINKEYRSQDREIEGVKLETDGNKTFLSPEKRCSYYGK